jgi:hypothetical protein
LTFIDDTDPVIILHNDETEYTIEGCDMQFRLSEPAARDNCAGNVILKAYVGSTEIDLGSYKFENEGATIVNFVGTDNCGNSATSTVTVNRKPCSIVNIPDVGSIDRTEIRFKVYPNPFDRVVKFEICLPYDSFVKIDIFTYNGTSLGEILNENLKQGDVRIIEFDATWYPHSSFIYRVTTKSTMLNGTIIRSK